MRWETEGVELEEGLELVVEERMAMLLLLLPLE